MSRKTLLLILPLLALLLAACGTQISVDDSGNLNIEVTLTESQVNSIVDGAFNANDEVLLDVTGIDFQNEGDRIVINGTYENSAGNTVDGSAEISVGVSDGMLQVEITAVDIEGMDLDDPRIVEANEKMARDFAQTAAEDVVEFVSVTIKDDGLQMSIRVNTSEGS